MNIAKIASIALALAAAGTSALAQAPLRVERLASMAGKEPEGLSYGADGAIYFTSAGSMELMRYRNGQAETFAKLPIHPLVVVASGDGFVADGHIDVDRSKPGALDGAGRLVALDTKGVVKKVVEVGSVPNGLVRWKDEIYLAADSNEGTIWRVDMAKGEVTPWLRDERLVRNPNGRGPGANGLKLRGETLYFANTSGGAIYTVKIGKDGKPGAIAKLGDAPGADDFDVTADGTVYVSTHGPIVKITAKGEVSTFADTNVVPGGPALMLSKDQKSLYVLTSPPQIPPPANAPAGTRPTRGAPDLLQVWLP